MHLSVCLSKYCEAQGKGRAKGRFRKVTVGHCRVVTRGNRRLNIGLCRLTPGHHIGQLM